MNNTFIHGHALVVGVGADLPNTADLALHARQMVPGRTRQRQHPILHFEHADNFAVAYYAGGETKPKGLSFTVEPEIEPEAGAWRQSAGVIQNVGVARDNAAVVGSIQGGAGPMHVGGQQHYGNQITATHGSAVSTGSGVAVAGDPQRGGHWQGRRRCHGRQPQAGQRWQPRGLPRPAGRAASAVGGHASPGPERR